MKQATISQTSMSSFDEVHKMQKFKFVEDAVVIAMHFQEQLIKY